MNRDNNRAIKKMMATAAVLLASFAIIVLVMYGGMETSKASSIEKVYATYTNPLNNKTIKVSKKSAYGKVSSKSSKIGFWFFKDQVSYEANKPQKKGVIKFNNTGEWEYTYYEYDKVISKTTGVGSFDLQSIFEMNKQYGLLNVKFFKGNYNIYNNYRLYSNTYVYGEGQNISNLYKSNNSPVFLTFDDTSKNVKAYNGTQNIRMKGLTFNCYTKNIDSAFSSSILFAAHTKNITIRDVGVINGIASHSFQLASVYNVSIKDCLFQNLDYVDTTAGHTRVSYKFCVDMGLKERNEVFNKEVIQIESDVAGEGANGKVYSMPSALLSRDDTPSKKITISNNTFKRVICAVGNHSTRSAKYQEGIIITNNLFDSTVGDTIRLAKYKNTTVSGNKFANISSAFVGGQRIRAAACLNSYDIALAKVKSSILWNWASSNYYLSSDGKYYLISRYKNTDNYKMLIK